MSSARRIPDLAAHQRSCRTGLVRIGLVGPIGVDPDAVASALEQALDRVNYQTRQLRLADLLPAVMAAPGLMPMDRRYHERMDAGNEFRRTLQRNDAPALLAIAAIRDERHSETGEGQAAHPALRIPIAFAQDARGDREAPRGLRGELLRRGHVCPA